MSSSKVHHRPLPPPKETPSAAKQVGKNLAFAASLIFAAGAVVAGALALYKIAFFAGIGTIGSQACLYGGSALAVITLALKAVDLCTQKYRRYREELQAYQAQFTQPPARERPQPAPQTRTQDLSTHAPASNPDLPPPLLATERDEPLLEPRGPADVGETLLSSLHLSTFEPLTAQPSPDVLPPHNNLHPRFTLSESKPIDLRAVAALPADAGLHLADPEAFAAFHMESQLTFFESVTEYLASSTSSAGQYLEILAETRTEALRTMRGVPPSVTIVGGGPSGLLAALEAYLAGATVHLVEKRSDYSRDTMLRLRIDTASHLSSRLGHLYWIAETNELVRSQRQGYFEREFFGSANFIQVETKVIEWLLAMVLFELARRDPELKIYREWECSRVTQEDTGATVTIKDAFMRVHEIHSDLVVGADGARSYVRESAGISWTPISEPRASAAVTFTNLWGNNLAYEGLSSFIPQAVTDGYTRLTEDVDAPPPELQVASRSIKRTIRPHMEALHWERTGDRRFSSFIGDRKQVYTEEEMRAELDIATEGGRLLHGRLTEMGWTLERLPSNRVFASTQTIYLGTDLPPELLSAEHSAVETWIAATLEQNFPRSAVRLLIPQIRNLTLFSTQLFRAGHVRAGRIYLIGDAAGTPDFQTGSGAKKALDDALAFGRLIYARGHSETFEADQEAYQREAMERTRALHEKSFKWGFSQRLRV